MRTHKSARALITNSLFICKCTESVAKPPALDLFDGGIEPPGRILKSRRDANDLGAGRPEGAAQQDKRTVQVAANPADVKGPEWNDSAMGRLRR